MNKNNDSLPNIDYSAKDILYMLRDLPDACCVFEVITDPFGTVKDMMFLFVNEKYASLVGKPTSELIGSTFYSAVSNRDEDWIRLSYQAAFMRQSVINRTFNTQFNRWFEFWAVPVYQKGYCAFIIHDVTAEKRNEENRNISTNSTNFVLNCAKVLSASDFRKGIKYALKELGEVLKADRVAIIATKDGEAGEIFSWADRFSGTGLPSKKAFDQYDLITMWESQLGSETVVIVEDTTDIREIALEIYKNVLEGTITSYIIAAIKDKGKSIGYLVIDNFAQDLDINVKDVVESMSIFISEELRIHRLTTEMSYINTHDNLTDLGNRFAYMATKNMIDGLDVSVGVCFIDINGLKLINDANGHDEGDEVIRETAELIAAVFKKKYCYRIGGDQFLVIIPQVTQEHFEELVQKLKKKTRKVSFAVGAIWADTTKDIDGLVNQADKLMNTDKVTFYKDNNDRRK